MRKDKSNWLAVCKVKARPVIDVPPAVDKTVTTNIAFQEDELVNQMLIAEQPIDAQRSIDESSLLLNDADGEHVDDESNGDADVQADGHVSSFQIFNQVLENEQGIYVSANAASCDVSNNPDVEESDESSPAQYHLPPTPQFEHVENLGNVISSGWTPWVQHMTGYLSGEFVVG